MEGMEEMPEPQHNISQHNALLQSELPQNPMPQNPMPHDTLQESALPDAVEPAGEAAETSSGKKADGADMGMAKGGKAGIQGKLAWFAMKVFFNRTEAAAAEIRETGAEVYIPMQTVVTERNGVRRRVQKPVIASLLFFRSDAETAEAASRRLTDRAMLYRQESSGRKIPAAISEREMHIFRLVVSSGSEGLEFIADDPLRFTKGDAVRVTGGPLAGAEGRIVRLRGDRRLVVRVHGVCAVATAYIPQCFLQPIATDK